MGGRGNFQLCRSICGGDTPDPRFGRSFAVYSLAAAQSVFATGEIKNANMHAAINYEAVEGWVKGRLGDFEGDFVS